MLHSLFTGLTVVFVIITLVAFSAVVGNVIAHHTEHRGRVTIPAMFIVTVTLFGFLTNLHLPSMYYYVILVLMDVVTIVLIATHVKFDFDDEIKFESNTIEYDQLPESVKRLIQQKK